MHFSDVLVLVAGPYTETVDVLSQLKSTLRQDRGKHFVYSYAHDKQGIIYWLGTAKGTTERYSNPAKQRLIHMSYSNVDSFYDASRFFEKYETQNIQLESDMPHNVKIIIDFSPANIRVRPNKYTLGYYAGGNGDCILRNWRLLGSYGCGWVTLKEHKNDKSITTNGAGTWDLNCDDAYQLFCIERTGDVTGSSGLRRCCTATSGFEIYGTVYANLPTHNK